MRENNSILIYEMKNIVCPQCGRVMGRRRVQSEKNPWQAEGDIVSDMICRECREGFIERMGKKER